MTVTDDVHSFLVSVSTDLGGDGAHLHHTLQTFCRVQSHFYCDQVHMRFQLFDEHKHNDYLHSSYRKCSDRVKG